MTRRTLTLTEVHRQELLQLRDHDPRPYVRERGRPCSRSPTANRRIGWPARDS